MGHKSSLSTTSIMDRSSIITSKVSVVFKTKCESKCQNELFLKCHFSGDNILYVFITEIICQTFDEIIDDP
jgi:hypothetical protein